MNSLAFHLAFPVDDLAAVKSFYKDLLGCRIGRETESWVDFDFFGHQISAHLVEKPEADRGVVDGKEVPIPHFGCVLSWDDFEKLVQRLIAAGQNFEVEPEIRFAGQPGEQRTLFIQDPCRNFIEFKALKDSDLLFEDFKKQS